MSRFDDDLRRATAPLAREQLPEGTMDESLSVAARHRRLAMLAASAAGLALIVVVAWGAGRLSLPFASDGSPSPSCDDIAAIGARSTEYRVFFPCANGSGLASAPRVMGIAPPEDVLAAAIRDVLNGPVEQEAAAGMASLAPVGSGDLLTSVDLQPDGLAVLAFDASLRDLSLDPRFVDAIEATGLQFQMVTALELQLGGSCAEFFAMFGAVCDHLAEPVQIAGDCPVVPPAFLLSGAGISKARPFPGQPRTVGWGAGDDTVIQDVGERGGQAWFEDGQEVTIRGYPGRARSDSPEFTWVEDGCPYRVTLPGMGQYGAIDYATVYGPVVAQASLTPIPSAPFGTANVEEDGIRLTLVLDKEATTFGERVWAEVTVENIGSDAIIWGHSSTCTWPAGVLATAAVDPPPIGRTDWPGDQGVLKNVSVPDAQSVGVGFTPEEFVDLDGNWGCTSDLVSDQIQPGERLSSRFASDTIGQGGMPPPGGRYVADSTFWYMGRGSVSPEARPDEYQVTVRVAVDVEGPTVDYLSPGEAMDLLLSDPAFIQMLAANPRERWNSAYFLWDEERWVLELSLDTDQAIVATVDAISGNVSGVELVARPPNN